MTTGDKGTSIVAYAGGFDLSGYTCVLLAAPGDFTAPGAYPPATALTLAPAVVQPSALTAVYTSLGSEFEAPGFWTFWLRGDNGTKRYTSPPALAYIFPAPAIP